MSITEIVNTLEDEARRAEVENESALSAQARQLAMLQAYLEAFELLRTMEPKMAATLLGKAHRASLDYAKLVGDE